MNQDAEESGGGGGWRRPREERVVEVWGGGWRTRGVDEVWGGGLGGLGQGGKEEMGRRIWLFGQKSWVVKKCCWGGMEELVAGLSKVCDCLSPLSSL